MELNKVIQGDCLEVMKTLPDNSVDAVVTDPPYGLSFMGKKWDYDVPSQEIWEECLRVLKPGGYLLSFGGTRTYHRMASAIEDAGFEVRDMVSWIYGSGFPKSRNIGLDVDKMNGITQNRGKAFVVAGQSGQRDKDTGGDLVPGSNTIGAYKAQNEWSGWGTALKPAHEPICMARKPLAEKTIAQNVLKYGTGGINIDGSRVEHQSEADRASATPQGKTTSNTSAGAAPDVDMSEVDYNGEKYWYKNEYKWLISKWLNDEDYVWSELKENLETYEWCNVPEINDGDRVLLDSKEGVCIRLYESKRKEFERPDTSLGRFPANLIHDGSDEVVDLFPNDSQRFFYCAKASKSERNKGCEEMEDKERIDYGGFHSEKGLIENNRNPENRLPMKNNHPTVKPIALMEYLVKLVSKEGAVVLDPFAGSGSTLIACKNLKRNYIGCELDPEYIKIAEARIKSISSTLF